MGNKWLKEQVKVAGFTVGSGFQWLDSKDYPDLNGNNLDVDTLRELLEVKSDRRQQIYNLMRFADDFSVAYAQHLVACTADTEMVRPNTKRTLCKKLFEEAESVTTISRSSIEEITELKREIAELRYSLERFVEHKKQQRAYVKQMDVALISLNKQNLYLLNKVERPQRSAELDDAEFIRMLRDCT